MLGLQIKDINVSQDCILKVLIIYDAKGYQWGRREGQDNTYK